VKPDGDPDRIGDIVIARITYASPRGGRVPAFVVTPAVAAATRRPGIILQHGMGNLDKSYFLPEAIELARAGAVALLPDAPDQRPAAMRTFEFANHEHDPELWEQAAIDLRRAIDVLAARDDVDPARIGYVGHSFGASLGGILAAVEPRVRAIVLVAPGSYTRTIRESDSEAMVALRKNVPKPALDSYLAQMAPYDVDRFLAKAPAATTVLFQFGNYDRGVSQRAADELVALSTATKEVRRYPTGHFITSVVSLRDRVEFFGRVLR
jgi:dienelactone hydrolase